MEEFYQGAQIENAGMDYYELEGYFRDLDWNDNGRLSREEFFSMYEGGEGGHDNGEWEDEMTPDD